MTDLTEISCPIFPEASCSGSSGDPEGGGGVLGGLLFLLLYGVFFIFVLFMPLKWVFNNRPVLLRQIGKKGNSNKLPEEPSLVLFLQRPLKNGFYCSLSSSAVVSGVSSGDITPVFRCTFLTATAGPRASQQEPYWMAGSR